MSELHPNPFETLEPPPGGLAGLRTRIARDAARRRRTRYARLAAAACVALFLVGLVTLRRPEPELPAEFQLARMQLGLVAQPTEVLTIPEGQRHKLAAARVPLDTDRVVFYMVGSARPTEPVAD